MKSIGALLLITIFLASTGMPAQADQKANQVLKKLITATQAVHVITADLFVTEIHGGKKMQWGGTVEFMKPEYLKYELWNNDKTGAANHTESAPHLIYADDGQSFWRVDDDGTMYKRSVSAAGEIYDIGPNGKNLSNQTAGLFMALLSTDILKSFYSQSKATASVEQWNGHPFQVITLHDEVKGGKGHSSNESMKLYVGSDNFIQHIVCNLGSEGSVDLMFMDFQTSALLTKADFAFTPPAWAKPAKETASSASQPGLVDKKTPPKVTMDPQSERLLKRVARRMQAIKTLTADYLDSSRLDMGASSVFSRTVELMKPNYARILEKENHTAAARKRSHVIDQLSILADEVDSDGTYYWELWDTYNKFYHHHAVDAHGHNINLFGDAFYGDFFDPSRSLYSRLKAGTIYSSMRAFIYQQPLSTVIVQYKGKMTWQGVPYSVVQAFFTVANGSSLHDETWLFYIGPNGLVDRVTSHENLVATHVKTADEEYTLSNIQINPPLSPDQFAFKVPAGYRAKY